MVIAADGGEVNIKVAAVSSEKRVATAFVPADNNPHTDRTPI